MGGAPRNHGNHGAMGLAMNQRMPICLCLVELGGSSHQCPPPWPPWLVVYDSFTHNGDESPIMGRGIPE